CPWRRPSPPSSTRPGPASSRSPTPASWVRREAPTSASWREPTPSAWSIAAMSPPAPRRRRPPSCEYAVSRVAGRSFELDPVEKLLVAAIGEPGSRRFFLFAAGAGERAVLACEKFHV